MNPKSMLFALLGALFLSFPAAHLIWIVSKARVLVDAGGGTFKTFYKAGAVVGDLASFESRKI
jgi:hypothetical protein